MSLDAYYALLAAQNEVAVPRTRYRHIHLTLRPFAVVAYHLAGDQGAPLGFMFGTSPDPDDATVIAVPEPRNRTERFDALARFGDAFNDYLDSCQLSQDHGPQLLFANAATAHWLLGLVARWTRNMQTDGDYAVPEAVPTAGKNMTALRDILITPGSSMVFVATEALTAHFQTGQLAAEDLNLGALLGWVDPAPGLTGPAAAQVGERQPPAGPLTDPNWDADELEPFSKRWRGARNRDTLQQAYRGEIELMVRDQLRYAWQDVWRSREKMLQIPPATESAQRYTDDLDTWGYHLTRMAGDEPARFRNIPRPTTAARTLAKHEEKQQAMETQMALTDPLVLARYATKGQVLDGTVMLADVTARHNGRLRPRLTIDPALACDLGPGDVIFLTSDPRIHLEVIGAVRANPFDAVELRVLKGANTAPTMLRLPGAGDQLVATPLTPPTRYPTVPFREEPWTHEMEGGS